MKSIIFFSVKDVAYIQLRHPYLEMYKAADIRDYQHMRLATASSESKRRSWHIKFQDQCRHDTIMSDDAITWECERCHKRGSKEELLGFYFGTSQHDDLDPDDVVIMSNN